MRRGPKRKVPDEMLLTDLRRLERIKPGFSLLEYNFYGQFCLGTLSKRFGSFNKAKVAAGVPTNGMGRSTGFRPAKYKPRKPLLPEGYSSLPDNSGPRICLRCDRAFPSEDVIKIRVCGPCKGSMEWSDGIW